MVTHQIIHSNQFTVQSWRSESALPSRFSVWWNRAMAPPAASFPEATGEAVCWLQFNSRLPELPEILLVYSLARLVRQGFLNPDDFICKEAQRSRNKTRKIVEWMWLAIQSRSISFIHRQFRSFWPVELLLRSFWCGRSPNGWLIRLIGGISRVLV